MINEWLTRIRFFFVRRKPDELDEELRFHVEQSVERNVTAGMTMDEARRLAMIEFGGVERAREQSFEQRPGWWLGTVEQDVRYALRGFRRNWVFAVAVIATLMVGIGATTAVFSVVDPILFRPLPYAHDDRLVSFGLSQSLEKQEFTVGGFFFEWRDNQKPFESVTFEQGTDECNLTEADPVHLHCGKIAQNFLPTLGMAPELGRNFAPEEDLPKGPQVAMISDGLWLSRFNRDAGVLGKTILIDGHAVRIVGVLPRDFEMPRLQQVDIVRPAQVDIAAQRSANSGIGDPMWAFARLKPGVGVAEAKAELQPLYLHTRDWIPPELRMEFNLQVRSIRDRQMQDAYRAAWVLLGAVFVVLLIACANVASLFSARGAARERELAVRSALGASRPRLIRQTLTEAALLSIAGAAAGCVLAEILLRVFIAIAPTGVPFLSAARLDLRIVVFTVVVSLLCGALFGILPALQKPRTAVLAARQAKSGAQALLRRALVAAQIGLCVVLLSGASLLVKSFWNIEQQNLGMQTHDVLMVHVPLNRERYPSGFLDFYLRAEAAFRGLPGVTAVGMSDSVPPDGDSWHNGTRYSELLVPGRTPTPSGVGGTVVTRIVTPGYFRVLGIPIVAGPGFTEEERKQNGKLMIVSKTLAARMFPGGDAVGQKVESAQFNPTLVHGPVSTIVGVAADVKNAGLSGQDDPEIYDLGTDTQDTWGGHHFFELQTSLPATVVTPWIRARVAELDATAPVEISTMTQTVSRLADRPRFETALLGFFACCGLLMAVIGLYGVIAFVATQRTQEIGVRMALGATRGNILRLIAGEGVRLIVIGGALGLGASLVSARLLTSLLFHVGARDPWTYVGVVAVLGVVALAATLVPARAAMKVEPVVALRYE
jgi:putative ABC transport system permease protein